MKDVRTRFAPSPTGSLHVGNARIAVLSWAVARHHGGQFVLRIEDTDVARNVAGAEAEIYRDLLWLGLDWDEGPDPEGGPDRGPHAPYHQRGRLPLYRERAAELLESGHAYRCFCSAEALEAERERALGEGRQPHYSGACRKLEPGDAADRAAAGEPHALRLATPQRGVVVVEDLIRGRVVFDAADLGDFVILRSDGLPTYNFAVVVDDADMRISHVIRGAGHLSNTPAQLLVYRALGAEPPAFAHVPTVLGPDRKKLSKRHGAAPLAALREEGLHPDGVFNYLSLLGWSSPSEEEVLERERIVREVTLDRVNAGDVVFDPTKMRWLSGRHIEAIPLDELIEAVRPFAGPAADALGPRFGDAVEAVRSHLQAFGEIAPHLRPFTGELDEEGLRRREALRNDPGAGAVLRAAHDSLAALAAWEPEGLQPALKEAGKAADVRGRDLYVPIRVALTGEEHGPPLVSVLHVRGREAVLADLV